jgi:hypothetical protein
MKPNPTKPNPNKQSKSEPTQSIRLIPARLTLQVDAICPVLTEQVVPFAEHEGEYLGEVRSLNSKP